MKDHHKPNQVVTSMTATILDAVSLLNVSGTCLEGQVYDWCFLITILFLLLNAVGSSTRHWISIGQQSSEWEIFSPHTLGNFILQHYLI